MLAPLWRLLEYHRLRCETGGACGVDLVGA